MFLATDINLPGAVDWVMMQSCFGQHFMLVLEKQERTSNAANATPNATPNADSQLFYAVVQLIGTRKQADSFIYRLGMFTVLRLYIQYPCGASHTEHLCSSDSLDRFILWSVFVWLSRGSHVISFLAFTCRTKREPPAAHVGSGSAQHP